MAIRPAARLAQLLEQASPEDRQAICAWLLEGRSPLASRSVDDWFGDRLRRVGVIRDLSRTLSPGEDSQLVTVRLPQDLHVQLRDWCGANGFSMAAVIRGLVERFLDQQGDAPASDPGPDR